MRDTQIRNLVAQTSWANWTWCPIAGDASARRYFRLQTVGLPSVILMDDPSNDTNATTRFADISTTLTNLGLAAPAIYFHDAPKGVMIIGDLGQTDFSSHLAQSPQDEMALYGLATDVLVRLHHHRFSLPLSTIAPQVAADMISLAAQHYAPSSGVEGELHDCMFAAYERLVDPTPHLALRDFHAENLIWRTEENGLNRVGLLDFQDACYAPAGYDLMSLLRDARRDVDQATATTMIAKFCGDVGLNLDEMSAHLACVSVQRNLRILGIFARLAQQQGKAKYLPLLPRVWGHLMADLDHPELSELRRAVVKTLPPPNAETLTRLMRK